jgi:hypothetical protein
MTDTHPAHARIAKANQIAYAALVEFAASRPEPRGPVHPEAGCWCTPCTERDDWLESQAEARAEERQWSSDRDADIAAGRHYPEGV